MAGGANDRTKYRLSYDIDGTSVVLFAGTAAQPINSSYASGSAFLKTLNANEFNGQSFVSTSTLSVAGYYAFIFPQLMNLTGFQAWRSSESQGSFAQNQPIQYSTDTANGYDGAWTSVGFNTLSTLSSLVRSEYRNDPIGLSLNSIKGIRFGVSQFPSGTTRQPYCNIHLFGQTSGTTNVLKYWHPTLDEELSPSYFDFGYAYRNSSEIKNFRLKNVSSQIANTITVSYDESPAATTSSTSTISPSLTSQYTIAKTNQVYGSSVSITSINPGGISEVLSVKRTISSTALIGFYSLRLKAAVGSWTNP